MKCSQVEKEGEEFGSFLRKEAQEISLKGRKDSGGYGVRVGSSYFMKKGNREMRGGRSRSSLSKGLQRANRITVQDKQC